MVYQKTVQLICEHICRNLKLTEREENRIRYGIEIILSALISLSSTVILSLIIGVFKPVLVMLVFGGIFKSLVGGIHMKSVAECALFSAIFVNILGIIAVKFTGIIYSYYPAFLVITYILVFTSLLIWSPAEVPEKPIKSTEKGKKLKAVSIVYATVLYIVVWFLFNIYQKKFMLYNTGIIFGILFQAVMINPLAFKALEYYEKIKKRG